MEGNYVETTIRKKIGYGDILLRAFWIACIVWGSILIFPINGILVFCFWALNATLMYFFWKSYIVDYEYIFCDGQIDFDIIKNNLKRKHRLRIQLEDAIYFAEPSSEKIINQKNVHTVCNFTSRYNEDKVYALIVKKQDKLLKILFEPSDKMLVGIKNKLPRKNELRSTDLARINM